MHERRRESERERERGERRPGEEPAEHLHGTTFFVFSSSAFRCRGTEEQRRLARRNASIERDDIDCQTVMLPVASEEKARKSEGKKGEQREEKEKKEKIRTYRVFPKEAKLQMLPLSGTFYTRPETTL